MSNKPHNSLETLQKENPTWFDHVMDDRDAAQRYAAYQRFDDQQAWRGFRSSYFPRRRAVIYRLLSAAAMVIVIAGVALLWLRPSSPVVQQPARPVAISHADRAVIEQSMKAGRSAATVTVGGRSITLTAQEEQLVAEGKPLPASFFAEADVADDADVTVSTRQGNEYWYTLEDGTRVHLNNHSSLRYPVHFTNDNRTIYVSGEAYIDVAHESRPFYVQTANATITDYGTTFCVSTTLHKGATIVGLVSGSIGVSSRGSKEYRLRPGEVAEVMGMNAPEQSNVNLRLLTSWHTGQLAFDGESLERLMNVISLWYGTEVQFRNDTARTILFTGSINKYSGLEATLAGIAFSTGLCIRYTGECIIIE